jgi:hypothetical protein
VELTDEEKRRIEADIAKVKPEDEKRVRAEFQGKYGKVGDALLKSRFKVLRDLALNVVSLYEMLVDPDYTIEWKTKAGIIFALDTSSRQSTRFPTWFLWLATSTTPSSSCLSFICCRETSPSTASFASRRVERCLRFERRASSPPRNKSTRAAGIRKEKGAESRCRSRNY